MVQKLFPMSSVEAARALETLQKIMMIYRKLSPITKGQNRILYNYLSRLEDVRNS